MEKKLEFLKPEEPSTHTSKTTLQKSSRKKPAVDIQEEIRLEGSRRTEVALKESQKFEDCNETLEEKAEDSSERKRAAEDFLMVECVTKNSENRKGAAKYQDSFKDAMKSSKSDDDHAAQGSDEDAAKGSGSDKGASKVPQNDVENVKGSESEDESSKGSESDEKAETGLESDCNAAQNSPITVAAAKRLQKPEDPLKITPKGPNISPPKAASAEASSRNFDVGEVASDPEDEPEADDAEVRYVQYNICYSTKLPTG